ncbi:MAG: hypothetical protein U5L96_00880 [Owenweeksia sp.]|nr:hypothetical protein [Owenweeksia sp.]
MRIILFLFFCLSLSLSAQKLNVNVTEDEMLIDGVSTAVQTSTVDGNLDDFKDFYQDFLKDKFDLKVKKRDNRLVAEEVVVNQITDRRGNLILFVYPLEDQITLNLAYQLGYDVYLNRQEFPVEAQNLQNFTEFFLYHYYYQYLDDHIKEQEKKLKKLERELKKAERSLQQARKKEGKNKRKIDKANRKIEKRQEKLAELPADGENQEERNSLTEDIQAWQLEKVN